VIYNSEWGDLWIYLVGPLAGGVIGGAAWSFVCARKPAPA
jgi:glycerol uptake facilitator-like aquaporin